jgi:hypothetical protein
MCREVLMEVDDLHSFHSTVVVMVLGRFSSMKIIGDASVWP